MGVFTHLVNTEIVADGVEKVVAGVTKCRGDVLLRVGIVFSLDAVPDPALRGVSFGGVFGKDTLTLDLVFCIDLTFCQNRCRYTGLESRTRCVGTHQRPIEKRCIRRFHQFLVLFNDASAVIGGPACDRQRFSRVDLYHDGRSAGNFIFHLRVVIAAFDAFGTLLIPVHNHGVYGVIQDTFCLLLQDLVDGQVDMCSWLRFFYVDGTEHRPGIVLRLAYLAVFAVEVFLKRIFYAVFPDHGIVGIAQQGVPLVLLLGHQAGVSEDMRRVFCLIITDIRTLDLNTDQLVLHDG